MDHVIHDHNCFGAKTHIVIDYLHSVIDYNHQFL